MKKIIYLFIGIIFLASSCTTVQKTLPSANLSVQVNFDMSNLEYIGEVTGTATQQYAFGIPIGGRKYFTGVLMSAQSIGLNVVKDRAKSNAVYDALMSKPDADFVLPMAVEQKTSQGFLGKTVTITIRGKAFKLKTQEK